MKIYEKIEENDYESEAFIEELDENEIAYLDKNLQKKFSMRYKQRMKLEQESSLRFMNYYYFSDGIMDKR